jgi:hypothetical protein
MPSKKQPEKMRGQLGMAYGTASGRLMKDLLFDFISRAGHKCFRCGGEMCRETFSVEHKEPWLDSEDPVKQFFSLENISYSHFACNVRAARRATVDPEVRRATSNERRARARAAMTPVERQRERRARYAKNGT